MFLVFVQTVLLAFELPDRKPPVALFRVIFPNFIAPREDVVPIYISPAETVILLLMNFLKNYFLSI